MGGFIWHFIRSLSLIHIFISFWMKCSSCHDLRKCWTACSAWAILMCMSQMCIRDRFILSFFTSSFVMELSFLPHPWFHNIIYFASWFVLLEFLDNKSFYHYPDFLYAYLLHWSEDVYKRQKYTSIWYDFSFTVSLLFNRFLEPAWFNCNSW